MRCNSSIFSDEVFDDAGVHGGGPGGARFVGLLLDHGSRDRLRDRLDGFRFFHR
jgi:hypothetical protein